MSRTSEDDLCVPDKGSTLGFNGFQEASTAGYQHLAQIFLSAGDLVLLLMSVFINVLIGK